MGGTWDRESSVVGRGRERGRQSSVWDLTVLKVGHSHITSAVLGLSFFMSVQGRAGERGPRVAFLELFAP